MEHDVLLPALMLVFFLLAAAGLLLWWSLRQPREEGLNTPEGKLQQQTFRQWRNRRAEEEMVQCLEELGWPRVVRKMTAEEVAHQLCNRLAVRLWNRPNVD